MSGIVTSEETIDDLNAGELKIIQPRNGYRFSLDPVLLCHFVKIPDNSRVIDLGTGSGIIPLLLARLSPNSSFNGLEIQPTMADRAKRNVLLNSLEDYVEIVEGDVREIKKLYPAESFDMVLSNPPFRSSCSGKVSTVNEKAIARHEIAGGLTDFVQAASYLIPTGKSACLVYLVDRLAELLSEMRSHRLEPKRLRMIHSREGEAACLFMIEGLKNGNVGLDVAPPLYVFDGRSYSREILEMYDKFSDLSTSLDN